MVFYFFVFLVIAFFNLFLSEAKTYSEESGILESLTKPDFLSSDFDGDITLRVLAIEDNSSLSSVSSDELIGRKLTESLNVPAVITLKKVDFIPAQKENTNNSERAVDGEVTQNAESQTNNAISICTNKTCDSKFPDMSGEISSLSSFKKHLHTTLPRDEGTLVMHFGAEEKVNRKKLNLVVKIAVRRKCKNKSSDGKQSEIVTTTIPSAETITVSSSTNEGRKDSDFSADKAQAKRKSVPLPLVVAGAAAGTIGLITISSAIATTVFSKSAAATATTGDFAADPTNGAERREIYQDIDLEMFT